MSNGKTEVHQVRTAAQRSLNELSRYDPEKGADGTTDEANQALGPVEAGDATGAKKALLMVPVITAVAPAAGQTFILIGEGAVLRVTAAITLGSVATGALVIVTPKQVFDIGWAIGTVANERIDEVIRSEKAYDRALKNLQDKEDKDDCEFARSWQRERAGIADEHIFKEEWGATPVARFDICACTDGSIVIKAHGNCGKRGPSIPTTKRWK